MIFDYPDDFESRSFDLLSIGGLCLEQVVRLPDWPAPNQHRISILDLKMQPGGAAPNVAISATRAGGNVALIGKIGDDERGRELLQALHNEGVNVSYCCVEQNKPTTLQIVLTVRDDWSALLWTDPDLDFVPEDISEEVIRSARFIHLEGYGMFTDQQKATVEYAIRLASEARTLISVDAGTQMAYEQPDYLRGIMAQADIAFANLIEASYITGQENEVRIVEELTKLGPKVVVLKMGLRGSLVISQNQVTNVPAYKINVMDTVGAGDGMVAGMLLGLSKGDNFENSARRGAAVGALVCMGAGAVGNQFSKSDVERIMIDGETYGKET